MPWLSHEVEALGDPDNESHNGLILRGIHDAFWSDRSTFQNVYGNKGCPVPWAKEEKECAGAKAQNKTMKAQHSCTAEDLYNRRKNLCFQNWISFCL